MTIEIYPDHLEPLEIMELMMYRSYEHQRNVHPEIEPEKWRKLYLNQEKYEKIYKGEIKCQ